MFQLGRVPLVPLEGGEGLGLWVEMVWWACLEGMGHLAGQEYQLVSLGERVHLGRGGHLEWWVGMVS